MAKSDSHKLGKLSAVKRQKLARCRLECAGAKLYTVRNRYDCLIGNCKYEMV